jgi:hypothetical protein
MQSHPRARTHTCVRPQAVYEKKTAAAEVLLRAAADPNIQNAQGLTVSVVVAPSSFLPSSFFFHVFFFGGGGIGLSVSFVLEIVGLWVCFCSLLSVNYHLTGLSPR